MSSAPIIYPGGAYRQLARKSRVPLAPRIINVHTMVGTLHGVEGYFAGDGRPYSHFGTGGSGEVRQWQDLRYRAASDLNGNPYCISIENEDTGPLFPRWSGSDVPRFTDKQADALVMLLSWLCHRFGLPREAITTSCPHERGIGYHRLGVNPYRHTGCGHLWSSAYGKACPGDRRIHQLVHEIIPRVSAPGSTPGGPVTDAVSRTSAIHLTGRLAGLTAAEIREVLDRGADAMPADLSLRAIRSDLARIRNDIAALAQAKPTVNIDTDALAQAVASKIGEIVTSVTDADLTAIAERVADEQDRRARVRLGSG